MVYVCLNSLSLLYSLFAWHWVWSYKWSSRNIHTLMYHMTIHTLGYSGWAPMLGEPRQWQLSTSRALMRGLGDSRSPRVVGDQGPVESASGSSATVSWVQLHSSSLRYVCSYQQIATVLAVRVVTAAAQWLSVPGALCRESLATALVGGLSAVASMTHS